MRTIILGAAALGAMCGAWSWETSPASAREWGFERSYYPGPFNELYVQRLPQGRWSGARVPRPHRVAVPPDGYWGGPVAVYSPSCKQRVLRRTSSFGWLWTTAWIC